MHKLLSIICSAFMLLTLMACGSSQTGRTAAAPAEASAASAAPRIQVQDTQGNKVVFQLNSGSAAMSLYQQLPLDIEVKNYSDNEKIFYPKKLDVGNSPKASSGPGTLAYYAPWADVVMFFGAYNPNSSLYELGQAVEGKENISKLSGTIHIEEVK